VPAYIIALVNVTNPDAYKEYAALAGPATAKYGGQFLARGGASEVLEGKLQFGRIVINKFDSMEQAKKFYHSPEYQEAKSKRLLAADFNMMVVEGVPG
jgi:uncharacterized protein (DUF1330 family)